MSRFSSIFKPKLFSKKTKKPPDPVLRKPVAIPASIQTYFESGSYEPVYLTDEQYYPVVKMVQLSCDGHAGQAVFREDTMLDLDMLMAHSGKNYRRMARTQYRRLLMDKRLSLIPPIPAITKHPTWVDHGVDELDYALVDVTGSREYMVVPKSKLADWLEDVPRVDMAMPIQKIDPMDGSLKEDNDRINASIRKLTKLRIERRLKDTLELPPLPDVARKLIELRSNPNGSVKELVQAIESDPTLAANVMRWANSSMYVHSGTVHGVHDAVSRVLGYDMVMNLIMGLVLGDVMDVPDHQTTHVLGFWEQAMWVAHGTQALAELLPPEKAVPKGVTYLTGLLHNFGYLILSHTFPPHFRLVTESTDINRHMDVSLVDAHILGITREQVAAELFGNWMIADEVIRGVRYQKFVKYDGPHYVYANLICLARALLIQHGVMLGASFVVPEALYQRLGIDPKDADVKIVRLLDQKERILSMAKMM